MTQVKLKARVDEVSYGTIEFEFGRVQANMQLSARGGAARKLKLSEGDQVEITIKKV